MPPTTMKARWSPLGININHAASRLNILQRSSHCLNVVGDKVYVLFGERNPRVPLDPDVLVLGIRDRSLRVLSPVAGSHWPAPRVGAASTVIGSDIYFWGGRGGKEMIPLADGEEGPWKFNTISEAWSRLNSKGDKPEERSYHTLASDGVDTLYIHAGCPPKGRLSTLHAYHIPTTAWTVLPPAPGPGRGGTVLVSLPSSLGRAERVDAFARYGGFAGYELGHDNEGGLDIFVADERRWLSAGEGALTVQGSHPPRRSVHGLVGVNEGIVGTESRMCALLFSGESGPAPAELGHAGAGLFHSDVYALIYKPSEPTTFSWQVLPVHPSSPTPEARGWFTADSWYDAEVKSWKAVMLGGLNQNNERLQDAWILDVVQE